MTQPAGRFTAQMAKPSHKLPTTRGGSMAFSCFSTRTFRRSLAAGVAVAALVTAWSMPALAQSADGFQRPAIRSDGGEGVMITDIVVQGNQRIEGETVRSYMIFKENQPYDAARVDASLKALFDTGLFADISMRRQGNTLIVQVVENPIINRIAFEGNSAIKTEDLQQEVQLGTRSVFTRAKVQSDVQRIIELYRRRGRFSAVVEPKVIQLPQNRIDLVFEISEGPVTDVEAINFLGNEAFSDGRLRGVIATKESTWWRLFSSNDNYDPDRMSFDRELLRRFYLSEGYADFRVVSAVADLSRDDSAFFITYTVDEGPIYKFGEINVTTSMDELDPAMLEEFVAIKEGETYDAGLIEETVDAITFEAGTRGYGFAEVRPRVRRDRENQTVSITFEVNEGPRVYVERINIAGNTRTLDRVIRREMLMSEGDAFNRVLLDRSQRNIRALRFFSEVEVSEEPGSAEDRTIVNIDVTEQSTGSLQLGIGFSTVDNAVADVSISESNFLGRGQFVRFAVAISRRRQQFDMRFVEPWFLGRDMTAGIDLIGTKTDYQDEASFDQNTLGFGLRWGFPLTEDSNLTWRYTLRREQITNVDENASLAVKEARGTEVRSSIGYNYYIDRRNDPIEPTEGWDLDFNQEFAGIGGTVRFLRQELLAHYYQPIVGEFIASQRVDGGWIFGIGEDVRLNDRYFRGGASFRGFDRLGLGPRDTATGDAVGAQAYIFGTTELSIPNGLPESLGVRTAIFTDYGYIGIADEQDVPTVQDQFAPRVSAGVSVYWTSPFGPVRFDFANVLLKEDYDETEFFRFSAGTQF